MGSAVSTTLIWTPANGDGDMLWGPDFPYRLHDVEGLENTLSSVTMIKSPSQLGETPVDVMVPPRVITVQLRLLEADMESYWNARRVLSRALTQPQPRGNSVPKLGTLRVLREGLPAFDIDASPRSSPQITPSGVGFPGGVADIELVCPYPYFREAVDSERTMETAGAGFEFSVQFPVESESNNIEQTIVNAGDVPAPIRARLYGDATTVRLRNVTTGEVFEVTGNVPATHYIEVNTEFGAKSVELVTIATGARVNAMDRLNLNMADLWQLQPGSNQVLFEADLNPSGRATVVWRQRYDGI